MRVKDCKKCPFRRRRTWTEYYRPRNYHPIGMTHAYAYCTFHKKRVLDVKQCARGCAWAGQGEIDLDDGGGEEA